MLRGVAALAAALLGSAAETQSLPAAAAEQSVLFVGNSFTFGARTPVEHYRPDTVQDLNRGGVGGVPALFKRFADELGMPYRVVLETDGGKSLHFHYDHHRAQLDRRWDHVLLQEYSTLDPEKPGDGDAYRRSAAKLTRMFADRNPAIDVRLVATWSRPDLVYGPTKPWGGRPIAAMAEDVQAAALLAAAEDPHIRGVIPVGSAFNRAIATGLADGDPMDGIDPGRIDLWADDHYHASIFGYYLEALLDFAGVAQVDPRRLSEGEAAARDLGITPQQAGLLQQIAADTLGLPPIRPAPQSEPEPATSSPPGDDPVLQR